MKWIGITGGIASGKSAVSKMIQDLGWVVVDADTLSREVVEMGSFGLEAVVQAFGPNILKNQDGLVLDRAALGKLIFNDSAKRQVLEGILHPLIQLRAEQERQNLARKGHALAFYSAALIFEKGLVDKFDAVILISSSEDQQKERLIQRDGLTAAEAQKRLASQMPLPEKMKKAHYIIDNNGSLEETRKQVEELIKKL